MHSPAQVLRTPVPGDSSLYFRQGEMRAGRAKGDAEGGQWESFVTGKEYKPWAEAVCKRRAENHTGVKTLRKAGERQTAAPEHGRKVSRRGSVGPRWDAEKQPCRGKAGPLVAATVPLRPTPRRSPRWAEEEGADRGCNIRAETPERSWTQHFHPFSPSKASVRRD